MTDPRPRALRHPPRDLRVPPLLVQPARRVTIGADALRAAYGAHIGATHAGARGRDCSTCRRYIGAIVDARALERVRSQSPESQQRETSSPSQRDST